MVDEFDMEENFSGDGVVCLPDLSEMDKRVNSGEEGSIKPSSTLRDKLGNGI